MTLADYQGIALVIGASASFLASVGGIVLQISLADCNRHDPAR